MSSSSSSVELESQSSSSSDSTPGAEQLSRPDEPSFSIRIKPMFGDFILVEVCGSSSVAQVKRFLHAKFTQFPVYAQRLAVMFEDGEHMLLKNESLLSEYVSIQCDSVVALMIANLFTGGAMIRIIGGMHEDCADSLDRMYLPFGMCLSSNGRIMFVTDTIHNCIQVRSVEDGKPITRLRDSGASTRRNRPSTVRISSDGQHLFVLETSNHRVVVLSIKDDCMVRAIGSPGSGNGQLRFPRDAVLSKSAVAAEELLFVADSENDRVQVHTCFTQPMASLYEASGRLGPARANSTIQEVFACRQTESCFLSPNATTTAFKCCGHATELTSKQLDFKAPPMVNSTSHGAFVSLFAATGSL